MLKDSSDINRASLDLMTKIQKSTYMCVCVYQKKKTNKEKNIEVEPSIIILHKNTTHTPRRKRKKKKTHSELIKKTKREFRDKKDK